MKGIDVFKRVCLWGLAGFGFLCSIFILFSLWCNYQLIHQMGPVCRVECTPKNNTDTGDVDILRRIQRIVYQTRIDVHADVMSYKDPNGKRIMYNISDVKFKGSTIAENGRPIRNIILSTWRSGSTFMSQVLSAHPVNFDFFEPLVHFDVQIRGPPLASKALHHLKALLNCEFTGLDEYITRANMEPWFVNYTNYIWQGCEGEKNLCYDHRYLSEMCKVFPLQSMKILRLRLRVAQDLLEDEKLGVRMVLLVRDPRGTLRSRQSHVWCHENPDCSDPALHCGDLVSDYEIATELLKKYPTTFRVIRYEDLAADPFKQAEELSKFYGRDFHPNVREFLKSHTLSPSDDALKDPFDTHRDSKSIPSRWKFDMAFEAVEEIQRTCAAAMKHWGYVPAMNATHLTEFNPVTDYNMLIP